MQLADESKAFLDHLENWLEKLPALSIEEALPEPEESAIISVDVINGFLYKGPLSSPRVAEIGEPITRLMQAAWDKGMHNILLVQEGHTKDSLEFKAFGEHAIKGTHEAASIDMIQNLPFYSELEIVYKDSIHPALNNDFDLWIEEREPLDTFIAVGDVTDICTYQLALYLRVWANTYHRERRVIVPANCTQTWHLSAGDAEDIPAMPHHGDLLHAVFLYHMALNGIEVVKKVES